MFIVFVNVLYISSIQLAACGPNSANDSVSTGPRVDKKREDSQVLILILHFKCYTGVTKLGNLSAKTPNL
jgi:hypothetical protein